MSIKFVAAVAALFVVSPVLAADHGFSCTNEGLVEVQCADAGCTAVSEGFTPLTIDITRMGRIKACALDGCWEGGAATYSYVDKFAFFGLDMEWRGDGDQSPDFAMVIQPSGVGSVVLGSYAGPVKCTVTD